MHIQSYPLSHNHPDWEQVFLSLDDAEVDDACQAWFDQWCEVETLQSEAAKHYRNCLPALHAFSNRTNVNLDGFIARLEADDKSDKPLNVGYIWARGVFTAAMTGVGWDGIAMRCATDPRAYAGYLHYIEREGLYRFIDDLAANPHVGDKLKEALDLHGHEIAYPWVGAACIRWAIFGENTKIEELPSSVQWLKALYAPRQQVDYWGPREVLGEPIDFGPHADIITILLQSPDLWAHMLLQEGSYDREHTTVRLWLQWARSVGYECSQAQLLFDDCQYVELTNCILGGDATELSLMQLGDVRNYLTQKVLRHHIEKQEAFSLPPGAELAGPGA